MNAQQVKEQYEKLTDNNMHGEAMLLIAEYYENHLDITQLKGINKIHDELGFITPELITYRRTIWDKMCEALPIRELLN